MNRDSILDILYNNRSREFQGKYIIENGKPQELILAEKLENEFIDYIKENIKDKKVQNDFLSKFENLQENNIAEMILWEKEYYKLGFTDGINLKDEIKKGL